MKSIVRTGVMLAIGVLSFAGLKAQDAEASLGDDFKSKKEGLMDIRTSQWNNSTAVSLLYDMGPNNVMFVDGIDADKKGFNANDINQITVAKHDPATNTMQTEVYRKNANNGWDKSTYTDQSDTFKDFDRNISSIFVYNLKRDAKGNFTGAMHSERTFKQNADFSSKLGTLSKTEQNVPDPVKTLVFKKTT